MNHSPYASWRKSSYSGGNGNCIEIRATDASVGVRDSKQNGAGPILEFASAEWVAFTSAVKDGEYDHL